jgi:hypothetical protein
VCGAARARRRGRRLIVPCILGGQAEEVCAQKAGALLRVRLHGTDKQD